MADFDPDAYLKKIKTPAKDDESWTGSAIAAAKDFGRGVAKGAVTLADEIPTLGTPHVSELDPRVKQFKDAPNASTSESIGAFAGENLPFLVGGPEAAIGKGVAKAIPFAGKMAGPIGEFAGRTLWGGAAGAAQPVKEGESRLKNAAGGAALGGVLSPRVAGTIAGIGGGTAAGLGVEELVRRFGFWPVMGAIGTLGVGGFGHLGLLGLARKAAQAARKPAQIMSNQAPAGLAGAAGGRAAEAAQENFNGP